MVKKQSARREDPAAQTERGSGESVFHNSFDGAVLSAGAAVDTDVSVDLVLAVALSDSFNGAVVNASAAVDASVSDLISHDFPSITICSSAATGAAPIF